MATVAASLAMAFSLDAKGDSWGSWGGSHGSTGFGGSSGGFGSSGGWVASGSSGGSHGGGLFGGHRPVRNLLGRISDHIHAKHARYASRGSTGSVGGGSTGFSYASHGSHGSHGGMGSVGSSLGSTGVAYGSMGTSYGSSGGSSGHFVGGYPQPQMGWSNGIQSPVIYDSGSGNQGTVIPNGSPAVNSEGTEFRPVDGINFEGSGQYYNSPVPPATGSGAGESTGLTSPSATVLNLKLPADARVFINDKLTRTPGESRRYIARNLQPNNEYFYNVKAIVVRDGVEKVRSQVVSIAAGSSKTVEIDFDKAVTSVAVNLPADAKITLCGKVTSASGSSRVFSTEKLEEGQEWNDYTIEVVLERNGKTIRQEKKLDIVGGQSYQVDFEFDAVNQLLAVK